MRMLNEGEEAEVEVTWEDQNNINVFSRLNNRFSDVEDKYDAKKKEKEYLDDLAMELELVDEDEPILYKIGESFMHLPHSECLERIEKEKETTINELEALKKQMDEITDKMSKLKVLLYGKFGKSINLEHD